MYLNVTEVIENDDGGCTLVFELGDDFVAWFKKSQGLKRWSSKRFEKWALEAILAGIEQEKAECPPPD